MLRRDISDLRARVVRALLLALVFACAAAPTRQPPASARLSCSGTEKAATAFEEALPLGNGRLGAMVFGDAASERVMLNDSTLWAGGPDRSGSQPRGRQVPAAGSGRLVQGRLHARRPVDEEAPGEVLAVVRAARGSLPRCQRPRRRDDLPVQAPARHCDVDGANVVHLERRVVHARVLRLLSRPGDGGPPDGIGAWRPVIRPESRQPASPLRVGGWRGGPGSGRARPEARRAELPHRRQEPADLRRRPRRQGNEVCRACSRPEDRRARSSAAPRRWRCAGRGRRWWSWRSRPASRRSTPSRASGPIPIRDYGGAARRRSRRPHVREPARRARA